MFSFYVLKRSSTMHHGSARSSLAAILKYIPAFERKQASMIFANPIDFFFSVKDQQHQRCALLVTLGG